MVKRVIISITLLIVLSFLFSCNKASSQKESNSDQNVIQPGRVCVIIDSQLPILMQPEISIIQNVLNPYSFNIDHIDLAGQRYSDIRTIVDIEAYSGFIVCLPYDFNVDVFLSEAIERGVSILQFGGDYYPNEISASINNEHVGYLMGKRLGETFINIGKRSPLIGFYSMEQGWKSIEQGFIEGLRETVPEAKIVRRRIISKDGKKVYAYGETSNTVLDGVGAFFCDAALMHIAYSQDIILVRANIGTRAISTDSQLVSLVIEDNGITMEVLEQFAQILQGNRTTRTDFIYDAVFEFAF